MSSQNEQKQAKTNEKDLYLELPHLSYITPKKQHLQQKATDQAAQIGPQGQLDNEMTINLSTKLELFKDSLTKLQIFRDSAERKNRVRGGAEHEMASQHSSAFKFKSFLPFSSPDQKQKESLCLDSQLNGGKNKNPSLMPPTNYDYSSNSLNILLGSDLKFKSPNKLMSLRVCESPWISNEKRNNFLSQFFENSPSIKNSNYKVRFSDTIRQESRVTSCFGRASFRDSRLSRDLELSTNEPRVYQSSLKSKHLHMNPKRCVGFRNQHGAVASENQGKKTRSEFYASIRTQGDQAVRSSGRIEVYPQAGQPKDGENKHQSYSKNEVVEVRKRRRKSAQQLKILKIEFDKSQNWTKEQITKISKMTDLTESQVYKWCWDQKKKFEDVQSGKNEEGKERLLKDQLAAKPSEISRALVSDILHGRLEGYSPGAENLGGLTSKLKLGSASGLPEQMGGAGTSSGMLLGKRKPFNAVNDERVLNEIRDRLSKKTKTL